MDVFFIVMKDETAELPKYATEGCSGFDIVMPEEVYLLPYQTRKIPLGFSLAVPKGYELQLRLRSSTALNTPLRIPNAPATIDSDYRGEVCVILENTKGYTFKIEQGTRLVQGIISPVLQANFFKMDVLPGTSRGSGGFGSTGLK